MPDMPVIPEATASRGPNQPASKDNFPPNNTPERSAMDEEVVIRTGAVIARASKTDPVSQRWIVRQTDDGTIQYLRFFGSGGGTWTTIPSVWVDYIVWDA